MQIKYLFLRKYKNLRKFHTDLQRIQEPRKMNMKQILKCIAVLLILLAAMGTASAAVSNVQATVTNNGTNYDVSVTWSGTLPAGEIYTVYINDSSLNLYSNTTTALSDNFINIALTAGTSYTIMVEDSEDNSSYSFTALLVSPDFSDLSIATDITDPTNFNVSWNLTASSTYLELDSGSGFTSVGSSVANMLISGNPASSKSFIFRFNDTGNYSSNVVYTLQPITFSSTNTSSSITWNLASSNWDSYEFIVKYVSNGTEASSTSTNAATNATNGTISGSTITLEGLDPNTQYALSVRGINGTAPNLRQGLWTTNTVTTGAASLISSFQPTGNYDFSKGVNQDPVTTENDTIFEFNLTTTNNSAFVWTLLYNNTTSGLNDTVTSEATVTSTSTTSEFSWRPSKTGVYYLELVVTDNITSVTQTVKWTLTVNEKSTGNRIWQDGMPTTYTWDARSFAGFYYDLDDGYGSEYMKISNIGRSIAAGDIFYTTTTSNTVYAYDRWGSYQIVGFMGDKYYAGSGSDSLMRNGNLSKVLIDESENIIYRVGQSIALDEGYVVEISQINVQGSSAYLVVRKDGKEVGGSVVRSGDSFNYTPSNFGRTNNTSLIRIHVSSVFQGSESSLVTIDGIFQISDKLTKLESGTKIDKMEIRSVTANTIEMTNHERISLSQGSEVTLMGKMKFLVADNSSVLRFAPTIEYTDPGTYEIRGTVSDFANPNYIVYKWTPLNFEGFYYDIDDDISVSEEIVIKQPLTNTSRRIDKGNITYTSKTTIVNYKYSSWGSYTVLGFMGEKYYAGVGGSLIKSGNLSKVLIDESEKRNMNVGQYIILDEGYALRIDQIDINGNRAYFVLEKDGRRVSGGDGIVSSGNDYVYKKNISSTDVEMIKVHVDSVFMGTESSLVSISGIFQASDNLTKLTQDTKYGRMTVDSYSAAGISLSSNEAITLSAGNDIDLMKVGNDSIYFKVGDNSTLRFAPCVEKEIGSNSSLSVEFSPGNPVTGDYITITVKDRGTTIEGAVVKVNNTSIGTTNSSGEVGYSTNTAGSYRVTAEKSGYVNGSATLTVEQKMMNMTVSVTPDVLNFGAVGRIKVTDSLNGSAISGATIRLSNTEIGTTDSGGELSYTFNVTGSLTIQASKSGYNNATKTVSVTQKDAFQYSNFSMKPTPPTAKSNVKFTFDATNTGVENGSHTLKLILRDSNGKVIAEDSKSVSVDVNKTKSVTLSVKPPTEGFYTLTLVEEDSNRTIDLHSSISSISVGKAKLVGSTIVYIVLAVIGLILLAVLGFFAYLFGVKGATKGNYKEVAGEIMSDIKRKFKK